MKIIFKLVLIFLLLYENIKIINGRNFDYDNAEININDKKYTKVKIPFSISNSEFTQVKKKEVDIDQEYFTKIVHKSFLGENLGDFLEAKFDRLSAISQAFSNVIDEFFIKQEIDFNVKIFEPLSKNYPNIIDLTLANIKKTRPVFVRTIDSKIVKKVNISSSIVFFVDWSIYKDLNLNKFVNVINQDPRKLKFLLYFPTCTNLKAIETINWGDSESQAISLYSFMICHQNETTLHLVTHEWFEPESCHKRQIKILNSFDLETKTWESPLKNYKKFRNFNGCHFEMWDYIGKYAEVYLDSHVPLKNTSVINALAQVANFTFEFVLKDDSEFSNELEILVAFRFTNNLNELFSYTTTYKTHTISLLVTDGEAYTNYEKLFLPFDELTWIFLLVTFILAFMLIFCINQMRKQIREIFFGKGVTMPSFNVVGTFFGIGQTRLPEANFSRFILMMFIIFCLIFRTAYQGVLFEFMNSDMRKPHAKTINEVFENNFSLFKHETLDSHFFDIAIRNVIPREQIEQMENFDGTRIKLINTTNFYTYICEIFTENEPKNAVIVSDLVYMIVNSTCDKKPKRVQDNFISFPASFAVERLHYIYGILEDTIQCLIPSGILKQSEDFYYWFKFGRKHFEVDAGPKVLTMSDLSYGFNIWLISLSIAISGFFFEIIVHRVKFWIKNKSVKVEMDEVNETETNEGKAEENSENNIESEASNIQEDSDINESYEEFISTKNFTENLMENEQKIDESESFENEISVSVEKSIEIKTIFEDSDANNEEEKDLKIVDLENNEEENLK
ncbi:hypothetical protein PVAND_001098 [Polypedilum vanderplanki]|uniref:Ionotropic receptor n=1 Tax=Polypedilum vanderplanki TaxID=319348 RepID=A0A9J6BLW5_POLVA|nr:hypothetical protein PVAND_001098 [Polypedilum vanderplanki]